MRGVSHDVIWVQSQIRVISSEVVSMPFDRSSAGSPPPTRIGPTHKHYFVT
jgi:hypothetical protein